jgi:hypothetical protein
MALLRITACKREEAEQGDEQRQAELRAAETDEPSQQPDAGADEEAAISATGRRLRARGRSGRSRGARRGHQRHDREETPISARNGAIARAVTRARRRRDAR